MDILIADDDVDLCNDLNKFLSKLNHRVTNSHNGQDAFDLISKNKYDAAIIDINMPIINGIELVRTIKKNNIKIICILISGKKEVIDSINSIDLGVFDFLVKPFSLEDLTAILENVENSLNHDEKNRLLSLEEILRSLDDESMINIESFDFSSTVSLNKSVFNIGSICLCSEQMNHIYRKILKLNQYPDLPVLIEGETGTGKEIIARILHYEGEGRNAPFIAVNCATINKELFEAEIFGYHKGAFTGANPEGKVGFIELAGNGTLFLDEISELSLTTQAKLLRVIQEKEYFKLSGTKSEKLNARIICATNINLEELVVKKLFREDLYFRLNLAKIRLPGLIDRKEEIITLAIFFIKELNNKLKKDIKRVESKALKKLYDYSWPGNIRELKNIITNAMIFNNNHILTKEDFQFPEFNNYEKLSPKEESIDIKESPNNTNTLQHEMALPSESFDLEGHIRKIIATALKKFNGNKSKTAKYLGLTRTQLYNRYKVR